MSERKGPSAGRQEHVEKPTTGIKETCESTTPTRQETYEQISSRQTRRLWSTHKLPDRMCMNNQQHAQRTCMTTQQTHLQEKDEKEEQHPDFHQMNQSAAGRHDRYGSTSSMQTWTNMRTNSRHTGTHANTHSSQAEEIWKGQTWQTGTSTADRQDSVERKQQQDRRDMQHQTAGILSQHDRLTCCQHKTQTERDI